MKINWKLRLKNKTTLLALLTAAIALVYQVLALFGVVPAISQEQAINIVTLIVTFLVSLGIVVDPTTNGLSDSELALSYDEPFTSEPKDEKKQIAKNEFSLRLGEQAFINGLPCWLKSISARHIEIVFGEAPTEKENFLKEE